MFYRTILKIGVCMFLVFAASCEKSGTASPESERQAQDKEQVKSQEVAGDTSEASPKLPPEVLISLGEKEFTTQQAKWMRPDSDDERMASLASWWLDTELLYAEAEKRGITKEAKSNFLAELKRKQSIAQELITRVRESVKVSEEEVRAYYESNKETDVRLKQPGHLSFTHVRTKTEEEAKSVLKRIKAGEDISAIAKELSIHKDARAGGVVDKYIYQRVEGRFGKEFFDRLSVAEKGALLGPIVVDVNEYEVVRLDNKVEPALKSFEEVKEQLESQLRLTGMDKAAIDLMNSLKKQATGRTVKSSVVTRFEERLQKGREAAAGGQE